MIERRVRRLTIAAPDDGSARRGALLVEDAMRIASLRGGEAGAVLVVRKLDLGVISHDASPQSVALAVERSFAAAAARAVSAERAMSSPAEVVRFADPLAPLEALAAFAARGNPPTQWYWPRVVPGYVPGAGAAAALRVALLAAARSQLAVLALPRVVDAAERARAGSVLGAIDEDAAEALLALVGIAPDRTRRPVALLATAPSPAPTRAPASGDAPPPEVPAAPPAISATWSARLATWVPRWGRGARARWLGWLAIAAAHRATSAAPALAHAIERLVDEHHARRSPRPRPEPPAGRPPSVVIAPGEPGEAASGSLTSGSLASPSSSSRPSSSPSSSSPSSSSPGALAEPVSRTAEMGGAEMRGAEDAGPSAPASLEPTGAAGLWFVVRVLDALGLPAWLDAHPWTLGAELPARILRHVADRARVALDDPVRSALGRDDHVSSWAVHAWYVAVRRWLWRVAELRLVDLVRRRGFVATSRTHVDVAFPLYSVDIVVRRTGLDIDPGWVPWLGRVITFHYREDLPRW